MRSSIASSSVATGLSRAASSRMCKNHFMRQRKDNGVPYVGDPPLPKSQIYRG